MKAIKSLALVGAATGLLIGGAGVAAAHSSNTGTQGAAVSSPGTGSGNLTQALTKAQTNACGSTTSAAGVLNPAFGNSCTNR